MSDQSGGPGWWLASDGRWYPPQPGQPAESVPEPKPESRQWWKRPVPLWAVPVTALLCLAIGAASAGPNDGDEVATVNSDRAVTTTERTTTTAERTTTTRRPTTTTTRPPTTTTAPTTTLPPQPVEVARFEGVVDTQTRDFTVGDAWELHWDAPGGLGCVFYVEPGGDSIDSEDQPRGSSFFREGGTYYLDVKCFGADYWNAQIVDVP